MIKILDTRSAYAFDEVFDGYSLQTAVCEIKIREDGQIRYVLCDWKAEAPEYMAFASTKYSLWQLETYQQDDIDELGHIAATGEFFMSIKKAEDSPYALLYRKALSEVRKLIKEKGMYRLSYEQSWYENE